MTAVHKFTIGTVIILPAIIAANMIAIEISSVRSLLVLQGGPISGVSTEHAVDGDKQALRREHYGQKHEAGPSWANGRAMVIQKTLLANC